MSGCALCKIMPCLGIAIAHMSYDYQWWLVTLKFWAADMGSVHFAEKMSRNIVPADLLWEKNTVPAEKDGL